MPPETPQRREPEVRSALNRLKMDKSAFTQAINRISNFCGRVERGEFSPSLASNRQTHLQDNLICAAEELRKSLKSARQIGTSEEISKFDEELENIYVREMEAETLLASLRHLLQAPILASGSSHAPASKPSTIKPFTLTETHTPSELSRWTKQMLAYFEACRLFEQPMTTQRSQFDHCLSPSLAQRLLHRAPEGTAIKGDQGLLAVLKNIWEDLFPVIHRRLQLFSIRQQRGEDQISVIDRLDELEDLARIKEASSDDLMMMMYIASCQDQELKKQLLELQDPTRARLRAKIDSYNRVRIEIRNPGQDSVQSLGTTRPSQRQQKGQKDNLSSSKAGQTPKKTCIRCGGTNHKPGDCKFITAMCSFCKKVGHLQKVCLKKAQAHKHKSQELAASQQNEITEVVTGIRADVPQPTP